MNRTIKIILILFVALSITGATFLTGVYFGYNHPRNFVSSQAPDSNKIDKVSEAMSVIKRLYVDKTNDKKLVDGAIKGMVESLGDPYSSYLDKTHFDAFREETRGNFEGIGVQIDKKKDQLLVISPIDDTPAFKAGLKAGDNIIKINGENTKNMTLNSAVSKIRGKKGTKVNLAIYRPSDKKTREVSIIRDTISAPNVKGKIQEGKIGYIRVHSFSGETVSKFKKELDKLNDKGVEGLILDLRSNPGGLLEQAIGISSAFIEKGVIVSTKGKTKAKKDYFAYGGADTKVALAVLVDHGSASASEIFAGAIQDYDRGVIIGEKTFGKASVQQVEALSDNTALTITIAKYFTPKGRSIAKEGIKPDIVLKNKKDDDLQLNKAVEVLKEKIK